uniref:hypothetical protein RF1 n=1 Tax=Cephaleuros diffusus TaxID=1519597 RepID=UPI003001E06C
MFLSIIKDFNAAYYSILTTQEIQNHDILQINFDYLPILTPILNGKFVILNTLDPSTKTAFITTCQGGQNLFNSFLGISSSSKSLDFLTPTWFDHLTTSNQFLKEPENLNHFLGILIILGVSSFFNSFLINLPLSITNIWCLRYSITHNLKTSCIAILGVVFGEICFMLSLTLPPPFIQIPLTYLESIWPYVFGIILIVWVIFDSINNSSSIHFFSKDQNLQFSVLRFSSKITDFGGKTQKRINYLKSRFFDSSSSALSLGRESGGGGNRINFNPIIRNSKQSCCFSYFGSLNLSSTSNFLDTYIFAASSSPVFLIVSCLGFAVGSFLTLILFNYFFTQFFYLIIWLGKCLTTKIREKSIRKTDTSESTVPIISTNKSNTFLPPSFFKLFFGKFLNLNSFFNNFNNWYENSSPFSSRDPINMQNYYKTGSFNRQNEEILSSSGRREGKRIPKVSLQTVLKLDKFLLTCLITFAFTTIPYYSFDYLFNQFIGLTPKDELFNNHNFFESFNYQGELFWTNLRDHRRQKRTRRSTRIKFKNIKSKIATSWKAFKQNDSLRSQLSSLPASSREEGTEKEKKISVTNQVFPPKLKFLTPLSPTEEGKRKEEKQKALIGQGSKHTEALFSKILHYQDEPVSTNRFSWLWLWFTERQPIQNFRENLSEPIKQISSSTFKDLSSNTSSSTYPKNWKKVITDKYYQNPIYKILLTSDLKSFFKREPLTQQITNDQERELNFLRIKMCHYFDTLKFYFDLKAQLKSIRPSSGYSIPSFPLPSSDNFSRKGENKLNNESKLEEMEFENLRGKAGKSYRPIDINDFAFNFKSMTSSNYHQRFKGTLKPMRELFNISLPSSPNNERFQTNEEPGRLGWHSSIQETKKTDFDKLLFNEFPIDKNWFIHEESLSLPSFPSKSQISKERPSKPVLSERSDTKIRKKKRLAKKALSSSIRDTNQIYNFFGSNNPFYVGWDKKSRKFILTSLKERKTPGSFSSFVYKKYSCSQVNFISPPIQRPHSIMYEHYLNVLNKKLRIFPNININNIDKKAFLYLYTYSLGNSKKLVSQLPQNSYKLFMQPTSSQDIFGPFQNTWTWPGSSVFLREYFFQDF